MTRIGLFGILGSGNLGNDGSVDAVVRYLRDAYPGVELGFFCMGPAEMSRRYAAPAQSLQWYEAHPGRRSGWAATARKVIGRLVDPARTLAWVRRFDVVIVPGMGVLEATMPLRPWAFPYSLFWLGVAARITGVRVALPGVGADPVRARATRWFITRAARLAHYRSYRDAWSRASLQEMGVDVSRDRVFTDLAFALPNPSAKVVDGLVAVGIMAYRGSNDDRAEAIQLSRRYVQVMTEFVHWLLDGGHTVRLYTTDQEDRPVLEEVLHSVRSRRSDDADVAVHWVSTLADLMAGLAVAEAVVGSRYHNVLCALKLSRPTLSVGYATKHHVLMRDMGVAEFSEPAREVELSQLTATFERLERERDDVVAKLDRRNAELNDVLHEQFAELTRFIDAAGARYPSEEAALRR